MPAAVEAVLGEEHAPDVSWVLNDPFRGGTHLPDITVITPVFDGVLIGFAASRAHHADVGGSVPGSMPADSRTLAEEGLDLDCLAEADEQTLTELVEIVVARFHRSQRLATGYHLALIKLAGCLTPAYAA